MEQCSVHPFPVETDDVTVGFHGVQSLFHGILSIWIQNNFYNFSKGN